MVTRGPLLVTAMAYSIHLILPLWEISCQCKAMHCNIRGPEDTTSILKCVHESSCTQPNVKSFSIIPAVNHRVRTFLPFVLRVLDGCERATLLVCQIQRLTGAQCDIFRLEYTRA